MDIRADWARGQEDVLVIVCVWGMVGVNTGRVEWWRSGRERK
jgi:hypothetical protein